MGGCCPKAEEPEIEISDAMNATVMCKCGCSGEGNHVSTDPAKNIISVSGSGTVIGIIITKSCRVNKITFNCGVGSCCLDCDTAYWEVVVGKIPENLKIGIKKYSKSGKGEPNKSLLSGDLAENANDEFPAWALTGVELKEGDVVGVYWDQTDQPMLSFAINGTMCSSGTSINRVRPAHDIYPAVSVKTGSTCCIVFDGNSFSFPPKGKFKMIICATSLI